MTAYDPAVLWLVVILGGLGTFLLKASFVVLVGRVDEIPDAAERVLRFVPAAVLAALVFPAVVAIDASGATFAIPLPVAEIPLPAVEIPLPAVAYSPKLPAAALAALVAWKTENVPATIAAGMIALWALQAL